MWHNWKSKNLLGNIDDGTNSFQETFMVVKWSKDRWHGLHEGHYRTLFVFGVYFPFSSSAERFHPRSPGLEGRVDVYSVSTHITARLHKFASVHLEQWITYISFFVSFFSPRFVSECYSIHQIYWEHVVNRLLGRGRFGLIYQIWFFLFFISMTLKPIKRCNHNSEQFLVGIWKML